MCPVCPKCIAYIYDILLYPVDVSSPMYPYIKVRESIVDAITPDVYRIQYIKRLLSESEHETELYSTLDSEIDLLYDKLADNTIISRRAGKYRFFYTHSWVQEKLLLLDMTLDVIHDEHSSGGRGGLESSK